MFDAAAFPILFGHWSDGPYRASDHRVQDHTSGNRLGLQEDKTVTPRQPITSLTEIPRRYERRPGFAQMMTNASPIAPYHSGRQRVFHWRTRRHRHILASGTGIVLTIFLILSIFWVAVGSCSMR